MYHINYQYLRPKKAAALKNWCEASIEVHHQPQIWHGTNATILPLREDTTGRALFGLGGVVDKDGTYVSLSCIPESVQYPYTYTQSEFRDEKVVYCGYLIKHWGHFLMDAVSRLWYFLENDSTIDKYVFFVKENEYREITGNYRIFFELLGVWDKLEIICKPTTFREVIVPELGLSKKISYIPKYVEIFETIAQNVIPDPSWQTPKKVFFSRGQFTKGLAYEFGFEVLDDFFEKNGYQILYPEKIPLDHLIHIIRNAEIVASISGSVAHNMLFAKQGQKLEILERFVISADYQVDVNKMKELDITYIDINIPIYPTNFAGPFIAGYTEELAQFAKDNHYSAPDSKFLSKSHYKKCFKKYIAAYKDLYNYQWVMLDWYAPFAESFMEGFNVGMSYFGEYINRKKPFCWHHYLQFHYWKQFVKRIIGRE